MSLATDAGRFLFDLVNSVGNSLSLDETLRELDRRLKPLVNSDAMAVWAPRNGRLVPVYASGADAPRLCAMEFAAGEGVVGQVASTGHPVRNADPAHGGVLKSALAIALRKSGVLALYRKAPASFGENELGVLLQIVEKASAAMENAVRYEHMERLAAVDPATSLPNERALFLRLDAELARCRRSGNGLTVVACEARGLRDPERMLEIGERLRSICREEDCVARMGEGFVLLLANFQPAYLAEKRRAIETIFRERAVGLRIGHAHHPEDGADSDDLLAIAGKRAHGAE